MSVSSSLDAKIEASYAVIQQAFERFGNQLSFCYNGGKDSVVLLDLVLRFANSSNYKIQPFFLETDDEFDEIIEFISESEKFWNISVIRIKASNLKEGLSKMIQDYHINSAFLGVRSPDIPNITLKPFERTSNGWPDVERVMPILDWTYSEIWEYIDRFNLPFCSLYSKGFTSIGPKSQTGPNPMLKDEYTGQYLHARFLTDINSERVGRTRRNSV